ncbi:helix-turn-helix transcriptional regulator [Micromonospora sp. WMMA1949]|uniref:helix-turn-helix domain-containing protein n=1 Tax=unclassified Micromonospora TaxID=2617518 RepID=UPI0022B67A54|nr:MULTISPECIES: helix-turn-helix transcriptional regulator [unclassified Micromonospora]MCZ7425961.1 helix-turn-helix transcriptional regulator [Micromonospora sp. WMMA1949]WBC10476.1 helix-turn-helix transcriptional regulator [Micromonospora sp. WMMA1947]
MSLLRRVIGGVLRRIRLRQGRTLREVAQAAGVSLPYLSEVERGRKEASSEVLAAICRALGIHLADLLEEARDELRRERPAPVGPGISAARFDRVPTARTGPQLRVGAPRLSVTRRPAVSSRLPVSRRPAVSLRPHVARRPVTPTPLLGGGLRPFGLVPTPLGAPLGAATPIGFGGGIRIWPAPSAPAVRPRPRTSVTLARRRARAGRRRPVAA